MEDKLELIKEEFVEVKNKMGYVKFFKYFLFYDKLIEPIIKYIHPCEFDDIDDLNILKNKIKLDSIKSAKILFNEQEDLKRQFNLFPDLPVTGNNTKTN